MRWYIVAVLIVCSLSSCATLSAGYYADVYLDGYDGPLKVTDTAGNEHRVVQGRSGGKPYAFIELDKRKKEHTVVVSNGVETSTHYLYRHINFNWLIPNVMNYEVGFIIDWSTGAVYDFPDIELSFRDRSRERPLLVDSLEPLFTARYSLYAGWAMPVYQVPVMFNHVGLSAGVKLSERFSVAVEFNMSASSERKHNGGYFNLYSNDISLPVSAYLFPDLFLTFAPTYQRLKFYSPGPLDGEDIHLASRNSYTIGVGGGVRLGYFVIEFRLLPAIWPETIPTVGERRQTTSQLRLGFSTESFLGL